MRFPRSLPPLLLLLTTTGCAGHHRSPPRTLIHPPAVTPVAAYTPAVRAGPFLFLSGVVGTLPGTRELAPGGLRAETRQALENLLAVLSAAGADAGDVVKCTVFLADIADYAAMNEEYARVFGLSPPARSALAVAALPLGALVEIECIALARR